VKDVAVCSFTESSGVASLPAVGLFGSGVGPSVVSPQPTRANIAVKTAIIEKNFFIVVYY
jgi:hypothetical protein